MRDEPFKILSAEQQAERRHAALMKLALISLRATKTRQENRWPCLVRPVRTPMVKKDPVLV